VSRTTKRILVTLALLVAYRVGVVVPVPGMSPEYLTSQRDQGQLLGLLSAFSGGAIGTTSITALGLLPLLASSLFFGLWIRSSPRLRAHLAESRRERERFDRRKRLANLLVAIGLGALVHVAIFSRNPEMIDASMRGRGLFLGPIVVLSLSAGAILVLWLAELITRYGAGRGGGAHRRHRDLGVSPAHDRATSPGGILVDDALDDRAVVLGGDARHLREGVPREALRALIDSPPTA
jgi:preprotein translocase subunit SecY